MDGAFSYCTNLTIAPAIPNNVTTMYATFYNCTSLTTAPDLSNCIQLTDIKQTFYSCKNLKTYVGSTDSDGDFSNYVIPSSVTNMKYAFLSCNSITKLPANYTG